MSNQNRRKLLVALAASALTVPLVSFGQQQGKVWRVGFLATPSRPLSIGADVAYGAFLLGMQRLGYVEGRNFVVEWRFGDNNPERLSKLAAELVGLKVDVIMTRGSPAIGAVQKAKHRLPCIAPFREYVEAGTLISYGLNLEDHFRRTATYVDKILKGTKPADIPVEQPTIFELFINRKTAKALGLTIPQSLLLSADKVID